MHTIRHFSFHTTCKLCLITKWNSLLWLLLSFSISSHKEKNLPKQFLSILPVLTDQSSLYYYDHGLHHDGFRGTVANLMQYFIHNQFCIRLPRTVLLVMLCGRHQKPLVTLCSVLHLFTRTSPQVESTVKGEPIANSSSYLPKYKIQNLHIISTQWVLNEKINE